MLAQSRFFLYLMLLFQIVLTPLVYGEPRDALGDWDIVWRGQNGRLTLFDREGTIMARLHFPAAKRFAKGTNRIELSGRHLLVDFKWEESSLVLDAELQDGQLVGLLTQDGSSEPITGKQVPIAYLRPAQVCPNLETSELSSSPLDQEKWNAIVDKAAQEHTSALILAQDGKILWEGYAPGMTGQEPICAMSASKSIVSLAVGLLIADGKLGLNTPIGQFFPEMDSARGKITVRQLLSHTCGVEGLRANRTKETIEEKFKAAPQLFLPGSWFSYNNLAVDFWR